MAHATRHRFTVYDVLQAKGVFDDNTANSISPGYTGPVQWPKMFYHPLGEERVLVPADTRETPWGPEKLMEQREVVHRIASNQQEADVLIAEGWHDHPAKAIAAGGGTPPPISTGYQIEDLERKIKQLQAELAQARTPAPTPVSVRAPVVASGTDATTRSNKP